MAPQRRANQSDIAERLGVSVSTVSRALANELGISDAVRRDVQRVARQLGYKSKHTPAAASGDKRAVALVPLPEGVSYGDCRRYDGRRCSTIEDADYATDDAKSDLAAYAVGGLYYRMNAHLTANLAGSAGFLGARGDDFRAMVGVTWSPQPESEARVGREIPTALYVAVAQILTYVYQLKKLPPHLAAKLAKPVPDLH